MKNPNSPFCYKLFAEGTSEEKCSENDDGILNSMVGFYTDDEIIGFTTLLSNGTVCISLYFDKAAPIEKVQFAWKHYDFYKIYIVNSKVEVF